MPRYFAAYEREFGFPILRPVRVLAVRDADGGPSAGGPPVRAAATGPGGRLLVETSHGTWAAGQ